MNRLIAGLRSYRFMSLALALALALLGSLLLPVASRASRMTGAANQRDLSAGQSASIVSFAIPQAAAQARDAYGKIGMSFELNQGQTGPSVNFLARGAGYTLFLTRGEAVFVLGRHKDASSDAAVLRMKLDGVNPQPAVQGLGQLPGIVNYFTGNEPDKWRTNIPTFGRVQYAGVYEGVDLVYYGNQRQLEYDFVVAPGADYQQIVLSFEGADKVEVDARSGDLLLHIGNSTIRQQKAMVYQEVDGERRAVEGGYIIKGDGRVGFAVGVYDAQRPLIIDPVLAYSTYLGGSDDDRAFGIAVDSGGNAYVTGRTFSTNFPTANAIQEANGGSEDAFVTKLNAAGSALVYSTYLGGSSKDIGNGIAVDSAGNAYLIGQTDSTDFPTANAIQGANGGGQDAFVAKLNPSGSALVYSTYLGGSSDDFGVGIAEDSAGNAYATGLTTSTDFPTANAIQPAKGSGEDIFVTKLNPPGSALVYSTYLDDGSSLHGTSGNDEGLAIAVDSAGAAYLTGVTDWLHATKDVFVMKVNAPGSALDYTLVLSGNGTDFGTGIAVDSEGNAYVTGLTTSINFPTANAIQTVKGGGDDGGEDAFVTKLNASGTALVYSTYLGGSSGDHAFGIAVDSAGNAYVTGVTNSTDFPTANAIQAANGGSSDAFVTKLNASGSALLYSTYLGGSSGDQGFSIALDSAGNAYVTGQTDSNDFPLTTDSFQPSMDVGGGAFISKLGDYSIAGRVIDSDGAGIADVTVTLSGSNSALTTTDANGNFLFLNTAPGGNFTVAPSKAGFTFSPESVTINNLSSNQDLIFVGMAPASPTPSPTATSTPPPPTPTPSATASATPTAAAQPVNLSTRMRAETGENIGIGGFVITGTAPKHVIIRAIGPSLTHFGFTSSEVLDDPTLELHGSSAFGTIKNDNWRDTQEAQIKADGLPPADDLESAIDATLPPGDYTALVAGKGNSSGIALVEVYDLDPAANSKLANLSTRALTGTGGNVVIAGFVLEANDGSDRIIVRGLGPSLASIGVGNTLADPTLELRDSNGTLIRANGDWQDDPAQGAQVIAAGLAPSNSKESAIADTLPPGLYTAILAGLNNGTGIGLVEIYHRGAPQPQSADERKPSNEK